MKTLLVVSKYKEDIEWTKKIKHDVLIYDKSENPVSFSVSRPNIGREAETLLYYIISKYYNLPDITIFLQGDPRSNPIIYTYDQVIKEVNKTHEIKLKNLLSWDGNSILDEHWSKTCKILHDILFDVSYMVKYSSGAQYVIPKECILNRPLDLYTCLYGLIHKFGDKGSSDSRTDLSEGIDAWTLELIWGSIFDINKKLKPDYLEKLKKLL